MVICAASSSFWNTPNRDVAALRTSVISASLLKVVLMFSLSISTSAAVIPLAAAVKVDRKSVFAASISSWVGGFTVTVAVTAAGSPVQPSGKVNTPVAV